MASTKVKGIVLGGTNIKEKDKIINLYTLEKGKISVAMRGVRGEKAKLKSAKDIFCFGEFVLEEGKASFVVTAVDIIDTFYSLSNDIEKYYEGCAILDIVSKFGEESNPQLFIETIKAIETLCYDDVRKYYVINKFLLSIFKGMGYGFLTETCSSCGGLLHAKYLNLEIGELVCPACKNTFCEQVTDACYSAFRLLENTDYDKLKTVKLGGMGEVQAYNLLSKNYEYRTGYNILKMI